MTRGEALDYLKHIKENYHWCCEEDALEMAIKALEQEPCEAYKRGWYDAIATALKETINYYTEDGVFSAIQEESLIGVGMSMQEPQTGHWINLYSDNYKCSECGVWWQGKEITECNYCSNCGVKMEREDKE